MTRTPLLFLLAFALPVMTACGGGGNGVVLGNELVRIKISAMTGSEPETISSISHPGLFDLDPSIAEASLTWFNEVVTTKLDTTPLTWRPSMAGVPPHSMASTITLTITPVSGPVGYGSITFTTSAQFANNPSSFRFQTSDDGFASNLDVILLDTQRTRTVSLDIAPTSAPVAFRWEAGNDGGEFGGGSAGFSTFDVVVRD